MSAPRFLARNRVSIIDKTHAWYGLFYDVTEVIKTRDGWLYGLDGGDCIWQEGQLGDAATLLGRAASTIHDDERWYVRIVRLAHVAVLAETRLQNAQREVLAAKEVCDAAQRALREATTPTAIVLAEIS